MDPGPDITELLQVWTDGDPAALDALIPPVLGELKRIAAAYLSAEPHARTLQTTALVNEAYLRLVTVRPRAWANRGQFFALTAQIMRRILVDHARARLAQNRGGGAPHVSLEQAEGPQSLLGLNDALLGLEKLDHLFQRDAHDLPLCVGGLSALSAEKGFSGRKLNVESGGGPQNRRALAAR